MKRRVEEATHEARIEVKFMEWQVGLKVQGQESQWGSMELKKQEEALAPLRVGALSRAEACRSTTGVGVDDFRPEGTVGIV